MANKGYTETHRVVTAQQYRAAQIPQQQHNNKPKPTIYHQK